MARIIDREGLREHLFRGSPPKNPEDAEHRERLLNGMTELLDKLCKKIISEQLQKAIAFATEAIGAQGSEKK